MSGDRKVLDLQAAKKRLEHKKYANKVLEVFDSLKHQETKQREERRAEVERKAKNNL